MQENDAMQAGTGDPILDDLLADFAPEVRSDPDLQSNLRKTFAYQARSLNAAARQLGWAGRVLAWRFRRRLARYFPRGFDW